MIRWCVCVCGCVCQLCVLAWHGSLCGRSLEIISFFAVWASLSSDCAVNQAKDYCPMFSHEYVRFHLNKVCTDNCYYLIITSWKETVLIRSFDWDVKRRETNVCFVVHISPLWGLVSAELEGFCVPNFDEVLVSWSSPISRLWENIHACPHPPSSSAIPVSWNNALHWRHDMDSWKSSTYTMCVICCLHGKLFKINHLIFMSCGLHKQEHKNIKNQPQFVFFTCYLKKNLNHRTEHPFSLKNKSLAIFFFFYIEHFSF